MIFNTTEISTSLQEKLGEEVISRVSLHAAGRETLFIQPASQLQVFNFLFYERQWRFDKLHNMMLLFQPGKTVDEYLLQYELSSKQFQNSLFLLLPYRLEKPRIHSVKNLYGNAAILEQRMTDIHQLNFIQRVSRIHKLKEQVKAALVILPF